MSENPTVALRTGKKTEGQKEDVQKITGENGIAVIKG